MGEMVERVAKRLTRVLRHHGVEMHPDDIKGLAVDAIAAMDPPTEAMIEAGLTKWDADTATTLREEIAAIWSAMLAKAKE